MCALPPTRRATWRQVLQCLWLLAVSTPLMAQVGLQRGALPAKAGVVPEEAGQAAAAASAAAASALAGAASAAPLAAAAAAQTLLDEINRWRALGASCGAKRMPSAPPMRWSALLHRAAELHVRDMAPQRGGSIGHTGSNGSDVGQRAEAAGYRWSSVGENVAAGQPTASSTLAQWMASPGHCSNIMNAAFADVAVAGLHLPGTTYNHYWVMVLGRP